MRAARTQWALGLSSLTQNMGVPLPRIHTFGVGIFCNHYFLKQLATVSRGLSDVALKPFQISQQIKAWPQLCPALGGRGVDGGPNAVTPSLCARALQDMMLAAEKPVLTDIVLEVSGLKEVEIYPFPIPDLYSGRPLIVSGKFMGSWPGSVRVVGMLADGRQWSKEVLTFMEASVPLNKVFAKQRIDLMAAKAWMDDDRKLKEKVVDLSVRENIPCVHTMVVGFEADPGKVGGASPLPCTDMPLACRTSFDGGVSALCAGPAVGEGEAHQGGQDERGHDRGAGCRGRGGGGGRERGGAGVWQRGGHLGRHARGRGDGHPGDDGWGPGQHSRQRGPGVLGMLRGHRQLLRGRLQRMRHRGCVRRCRGRVREHRRLLRECVWRRGEPLRRHGGHVRRRGECRGWRGCERP